jgi:hypothetical protein
MQRLLVPAGTALIIIGVVLVIASLTSVGKVRSWDRADDFAKDSRQTSRRMGVLLGAVGLAALVAVSPIIVARLHDTPGFGPAVAGVDYNSWRACITARLAILILTI